MTVDVSCNLKVVRYLVFRRVKFIGYLKRVFAGSKESKDLCQSVTQPIPCSVDGRCGAAQVAGNPLYTQAGVHIPIGPYLSLQVSHDAAPIETTLPSSRTGAARVP